MTVGERIKARREELGLTLQEVADAIGVGRQAVFKYENGVVTNIPLDRLESLAEVLRIPRAELAGWQEPPRDPLERFQRIMDDGGVHLLLDADSKLTSDQIDKIVDFIRYQQEKHDRK